MNLVRTLAASLLMLSTVGCCCMDPCGSPCGSPYGGCLLPFLFQPCHGGCNCVYDDDCCDYGYDVGMFDAGCSCGQCGRGSKKMRRSKLVSRRGNYMNGFVSSSCCDTGCGSCCGGDGGWVEGSMLSGGGGCGCGQSSSMGVHSDAPTMMSPSPMSTPTPSAIVPVPPAGPTESDSTGAGAMYRNIQSAQPQMVSYEEFQRLPGTVVAGPGAVPEAQMNQVASAPMPAAAPMQVAPVQTAPKMVTSVPRVTNTPSHMSVRPSSLLPPSNVASQAQQAAWIAK